MRGSRGAPVMAASASDCSPAQVTTRRAVMVDPAAVNFQLPGARRSPVTRCCVRITPAPVVTSAARARATRL